MYMTLLHWIGVGIFVLVFIVLTILSLKEKDPKNKKVMIFFAFAISLLGVVITLFALEKYTKKYKLLSYTQKRMLSTESVVFQGKIQNTGKFKLAECKIKVKFTNNVMTMGRPKNTFFKPSSDLGWLFGDKKKDDRPNTIEEQFSVAKNIAPKEIKNFRIYMKYPPYMKSPLIKLKLKCH